ncbi:MAG: barstar family protein [Bacteroidota bacterium]
MITYTELEGLSLWVHLLAVTESEIDDLTSEIQGRNGKAARILRGQRCQTRERLFQEFAAALQFPHYFGDNWDALEECLGDLEWLGAEQLILVITNADNLLPRHDGDLRTLASILQTVHELEETPLERVIFQCTPEGETSTRQRLGATGLTIG